MITRLILISITLKEFITDALKKHTHVQLSTLLPSISVILGEILFTILGKI